VHVAAGLVSVIAGAAAMLSRKGIGRHTKAGIMYYRSLLVAVITMSLLAVMRWPQDTHLLVLGLLSLTGAVYARQLIRARSAWRIRGHILGMGSSYVLLLVAFYVDNGMQLPVWRHLPHATYWLIPSLVGVPFMARSFWSSALARAERAGHRPS
jgi:hypothetical protein